MTRKQIVRWVLEDAAALLSLALFACTLIAWIAILSDHPLCR